MKSSSIPSSRMTHALADRDAPLTAPDGSITTYGYDTDNQLNGLANSWAGSFGFAYDALGRRTSLTRPNGVNTSYSYDSVSHLLSVLHQAGSNTLDGASYTYDPAGNRLSKTNQLSGVTSNYGYDLLYELTQVTEGSSTTESYSYDAVGNRLSSSGVPSYSYNSSNQLTSNSNGSYTYDANGNTLTDAQGRSFTWDFENRMTQAVVPGTNGGTTTFKYDPFGRRIYKSSPSFIGSFLYDGSNLIETVNGSGSEVASYTQGLGVDEMLAMQRGGTQDYYEPDGLGSITSLSGSAGTLANTYTYDSFGNLTASTGTLRNYFQYAAREFDPETSLYYYRARYYDQSIGRFLSEDQSDEGSLYDALNLYMYVQNNPANNIDPFGKYTLKPGVPPPSAAVAALLDCIEALSGIPLVVTSTSDSHSPTDPHTRGLAADIRYPSNPAAVLNAAACCGAQYAQDEKKNPSANATAPHIHIQLVPGKRGGHGDLPKNPKCKDCSKD